MNKQNRVKQRNESDVVSKWREKREIGQPPNLDQDHKVVDQAARYNSNS